jgi:hypothetical protein
MRHQSQYRWLNSEQPAWPLWKNFMALAASEMTMMAQPLPWLGNVNGSACALR